ncbi:prophage antirepressor [Thiovulum sp. ES]|nr:prophage antirepressor [Thiovulum sp. ES]
MNLKKLEKMPENFKFFQGKEIRTFVDLDIQELWFVAKDVANILGYQRSNGKVDTNNMLKRIEVEDKGTEKIRTLGGIQKMSLINESGIYTAIIGSKKVEAKDFKQWLTKEVLPSIRKNGFYISKEISDSQVSDLVEKANSIYEERKLFDLEHKRLKSVIYGELLKFGATQKQISGMFSRMFQNLHIATVQKTAGQIVFDEMKEQQKKLSIKSFNQLRNYRKELKADLLIAINYYSDDELKRFKSYLNSVITDLVQYIESPHTKVSLSSLAERINRYSEIKALEMTDYNISRFPRPLRAEVKILLDLILKGGDEIEIFELMETIRITYHNLKKEEA